MLYEIAYPILFAGAKTQQVATQAGVRLGLAPRELRNINYRPETRFRILCWYLRKADISLLMRLAPGRAAKVALKRFETTKRDPRPPAKLASPERMCEEIVQYDGKRVRIVRYGPEGGPKALLLHGWNGRAAMLHKMALALAEAGYAVTVPDLPGHGASEGQEYSFFDLGKAVARLFEGEVFDTVVGHSGGGLIAALALGEGLNTHTFVPIGSPVSMVQLMQSYVEVSAMPKNTLRHIARNYRKRYGVQLEEAGAPILRKRDLRTLVIHDKADWMVGVDNAHEWAETARNSELMLTKRLTHLNILNAPSVHERIAAFAVEGRSDV